jgi:hypothetical protein
MGNKNTPMKKFGIVVVLTSGLFAAAQCITSAIQYSKVGKTTDLGFSIGFGFACLVSMMFVVGMIMTDELTKRLRNTKP